jgi:5-methylcytosine-specific restriction endonuclease McrA
MIQIKVYVRNQDGTPLMPCTPTKARKLLQAGKAKVVERCPFTILLGWQCEGHVQQVMLGVDKGSSVTGIACVGNGEILLAAETYHRRDIKEKLETRRLHRRSRRSRKWYRPRRFLNRATSRCSGRLPPSIKTNVEEVIRVVKQIPLPISQIVIEDVQVDIARLNDPTLAGTRYQDPTRLDENLRIACLMRDGYTCQQCGKRTCRLEAHHIVFREQGGKDTLANLLCLCERCHHQVHEGTIRLQVTGVSGYLDQVAQRTMQGKTYLYATSPSLFLLRRCLVTKLPPIASTWDCRKHTSLMPFVSRRLPRERWFPFKRSMSTRLAFVLGKLDGSIMTYPAKVKAESNTRSMRN